MSASAATETLIIAIVTTIAALVPSSTLMTVVCIAVGTTMTATERDQAKSVLRDCSTADTSSLKHYYEAATGAELKQAFDDIVQNIEKITVTK